MTETELKDALWQAVRAAAAIAVFLFTASPALAQDYTVGAEGRWWGVTVNWTAPAGHGPLMATLADDSGVLDTHYLPSDASGSESFDALPPGTYRAQLRSSDILTESGFIVQAPSAKLTIETSTEWVWVNWTTNELDNRLRLDVIGGGQTVSYGLPNDLAGVVDFPAAPGSYEAQVWAGDTLLDAVTFTVTSSWATLEVVTNNNRAWGLWTASPGHERLILRLWYGSVVKDERVLSSDISGSEFFSGLKNGTYRAQILTLEGVILAQADFTIKKKGR